MGHTKADVVEAGLGIIDDYGLSSLSMRRLATALGVQQSALYWHFDSKQLLLAEMAEEILRRGRKPLLRGTWKSRVTARAEALRDALLAYRDGAEIVSTVHAFGLGAEQPHRELAHDVAAAGADQAVADVAATVILQFVLGFTFSEQQRLQASSAGAVDGDFSSAASTAATAQPHPFSAGIALILDGVSVRLSERLPG